MHDRGARAILCHAPRHGGETVCGRAEQVHAANGASLAHYNPYLQHWWLKFLEVESNFVDMVRLRERVTLAISPFFLFANTHLTDSIGQGHEERIWTANNDSAQCRIHGVCVQTGSRREKRARNVHGKSEKVPISPIRRR